MAAGAWTCQRRPASAEKKEWSYDVVVGLPSLNKEESIGLVTRVVDEGCQKYFGNLRCLLLNADCRSTDGTQESFLKTPTACEKEHCCTELHAEGKGAALRLVFHRMVEVGAPMGLCFDTDLKTITAEWLRPYAEALKGGADFVLPKYQRHRCDAPITNLVTHPLVSALFACNVRQPIGGDFGFSLRAVQAYLGAEWVPMTRGYGIDIFMTTRVLEMGYKVIEVELPPKIHAPALGKTDRMAKEVLSSFFFQVKRCQSQIAVKLEEDCCSCSSPELIAWAGSQYDMSIPEYRPDPSDFCERAWAIYTSDKEALQANTPKHIIPDIEAAVRHCQIDSETFTRLLFWAIAEFCAADAARERSVLQLVHLAWVMRSYRHISVVQDLTDNEAEDIVAGYLALCMEERRSLKGKLLQKSLVVQQSDVLPDFVLGA